MKYYSEKLSKLYDTPQALKEAEEKFEASQKKKEATKKDLSQNIEIAENALDAAYKNYEDVKKAAAKLMEESNKQILGMLEDAKKKIKEAEKARTDAIAVFNQNFGTYKANYTGDRAKREYDRVANIVNDIFLTPYLNMFTEI